MEKHESNLPKKLELFMLSYSAGDDLTTATPITENGPRYTQLPLKDGTFNRLSGGRGSVAKMYDTKLKRAVAAKHIWSDAKYLIKEARTIAKLKHDNVLVVHDLAITNPEHTRDRELYIITEWLEGDSLEEWVLDAHPLEAISQVLNQVASGISYINSTGRVFGDLKPRNIMFDHLGKIKIIDFGLAAELEGEVAKTNSFSHLFSPPEQRDEILTLKTDVYSFAAFVYEIFFTNSPDDFDQITSRNFFINTPNSPTKIKKEYLNLFKNNQSELMRLYQIVRQGLNKDRDKRPTIDIMNKELQNIFAVMLKK